MAAGRSAKDVVATLTTNDGERDWRQLLVMDRDGGTAGATGASNETVLGVIEAQGLIVGGNMLASDSVLTAMKDAYEWANASPLGGAARCSALTAGEAEGGDKRGTCSAAMLVQDEAPWPLNLRIDFAADLVASLDDLYRRSRESSYRDFRLSLPG